LNIKDLRLVYQGKARAKTGTPHPSRSTIFIGKSNPEDEEWKLSPRSAQPKQF